MKVLAKTVGTLATIIFVTLLVKTITKSRSGPTIKPVSNTFLISCDFFEPLELALNSQGDIIKNCGSCITWNGESCSDKARLKSHYNI